MKFSVNQAELQNALTTVYKGTSTKSTIPVLAGIHIKAEVDSLVLQATDLQLSVQYSIPALVDEEGETVVPGKLFTDVIKNLNDAAVNITAEDDSATILCDSSSFVIRTLDAADFPSFPKVEVLQEIAIPYETFASMAKKVSRATSKDESHMIMTGINIVLEENKLSMVATDSYRLALTTTEIENPNNVAFQAVISAAFMADVTSLPKNDCDIVFGLTDNQIVIRCQDIVLVNRKIEGSYPAYKRLLPTSYITQIALSRSQLVGAVRRASLLGANGASVKFDINIPSQTLQLSSSQDSGSLKETIAFTGEGEDMQIGFNCAYLLDGLTSIDSENIILTLTAANKPGVFKADSDDKTDYLYLVMPMRA